MLTVGLASWWKVQPGNYHCRRETARVSGDPPSDVQAVLSQLVDAGETAIRSGELETARQTVTSAETVSRNKLPEGDLREQMIHGCSQVTVALDEGLPETAAEYLRAMGRRLAATSD